MPETESGDGTSHLLSELNHAFGKIFTNRCTALPGMGAGGVADVSQGNSGFGANGPKKQALDGVEKNNINASSTDRDAGVSNESSSRPSAPKRQKTGDVDVSGLQNGSSDSSSSNLKSTSAQHQSTTGSAVDPSTSDLDQIARYKAEKYVNIDEDEPHISSASTKQDKNEARADRRADALGESRSTSLKGQKTHGGNTNGDTLHEDAGNGRGSVDIQKRTNGNATEPGNRKADSVQGESGSGELYGGNDLEKVQRHQAVKFGAVNLEA